MAMKPFQRRNQTGRTIGLDINPPDGRNGLHLIAICNYFASSRCRAAAYPLADLSCVATVTRIIAGIRRDDPASRRLVARDYPGGEDGGRDGALTQRQDAHAVNNAVPAKSRPDASLALRASLSLAPI